VDTLLAAASGDRVEVHTVQRAEATAVLAAAGGTVSVLGPGSLTVAGLAAGRIAAELAAHALPFTRLAPHRASLEEAYLDLTREVADYRAQDPAGAPGAPGAAGANGAPGEEARR
jgi:ABC-2 type transport system ATP-binding protein